MKKKFLFLTLLAIVLTFTMVACGDNDEDLSPGQVPAVVKEKFETMFPGVTEKWKKRKRGFYRAEFFNSMGKYVYVYFQTDGTWVSTVTEIYPSELPQVVKDYVAANYAGWYIDDAVREEAPGGNFYMLELDRAGEHEIYLQITEEGLGWEVNKPDL